MPKATTAYIGLGSNLGDRAGNMDKALSSLAENGVIELMRVSRIIETPPLGAKNQPGYINAVAEIKTYLDADRLLQRMAKIESALGRVRAEKWSSRTIDLDLLLFGNKVIDTSKLTVPHSQMHLRSFVLSGLSELNSSLIHPVIKQPVRELAARLNGQNFTLSADMPQLICTAGVIGIGKTTLAKALAEVLACKSILEAYDTNPFMPEVYAGRKELALDSQLYFLASRVEQLGLSALVSGQVAVADYIFDKELIYAGRLLGPEQQSLYRRINAPLTVKVNQPVVVLYLQDSPENCLKRIRRRNRSYEQKIELKFLQDLRQGYDALFADWKTCPLIRISMSECDCTNESDVARLANEMKSYIAVKG